jgi:tRNA(fMet)-specific endonuclease VapC
MNYIIDTNIITAYLKGNDNIFDKINEIILRGEEVFINGISYYEIKRGLLYKNAKKQLRKFEIMCETCNFMSLDDINIFDKASNIYSELKRKGKLIKDADILISSISLIKNCILVSNDTDFNRIDGLKIENWLK